MAGTLYVVATPIGHLGDLTVRAAEVLRQVATIAAEDTRETRKLVSHVGSGARLVSWHAHSTESQTERLLALLAEGQDVALVTDAGTPGVSDPGPLLVRAARAAGHLIVPVPGPSAVATALMASGLPADRYLFLGFPPRKGGDRTEWLERIRDADCTVVCFEAPGRVVALLGALAASVGPDRRAMVGREMTKRFEEYRAGTIDELLGWAAAQDIRGEVTLVIEGGSGERAAPEATQVAALIKALTEAGMERSRVARVVTEVFGVPRNESYRLVMED